MAPFSPNGIGIGGPSFDPFGQRYLPRVESRSRQRPEFLPAVFAFPGDQARFLRAAVPPGVLRPAARASADGDRIDECDLVRAGRTVLRVVPFGKRGNHHARRAEAIRKFGFQSLFLFVVHFGGSALWRAFSRNRQAPKGRTPAERLLL